MAASPKDIKLPTSAKDREKLKVMIEELVKSMRRKEDESIAISGIAKEIKALFGLPTKYTNKIARTLYKQNFEDVQADYEAFEAAYVTITEGEPSSE